MKPAETRIDIIMHICVLFETSKDIPLPPHTYDKDNGPWTYEYVSSTPEVGQNEKHPPPPTYDKDNGPWTYEYVSPTPEVGQDEANKK